MYGYFNLVFYTINSDKNIGILETYIGIIYDYLNLFHDNKYQ